MKKGYIVALAALTALTVLSLALNVAVVFGLLRARDIALVAVAKARTVLTEIGDDAFSYTVEVAQEIPIATTIPFNETVTVPINTTIPISTTVTVPINLGITSYNLAVPIRTLVPVDLEVTVPISRTIAISTTVPLDVAVPIEIPIADTPLAGHLEGLDAELSHMEERLANPLSEDN